jgi:signal transduction histidine kinase
VAVGVAFVGGYFLAGRVLAPVGAMADTARRITAESLHARLPVDNRDVEFGRLAGVFNDTLTRLQDAFEQLRRFTADASHELRTPLTAMRSGGEVALHRPLTAAAYRDVIGSMLEEVDRLTRLVDSLLTLTRAEAGRIPLSLQLVDLGELVVGATDSLRVLAEDKEQTLSVAVEPNVRAECDSGILRQGIDQPPVQRDQVHAEQGKHLRPRDRTPLRRGRHRGEGHGPGYSGTASAPRLREVLPG